LRPRRSRNLRAIGICAAIAVGASLGVLAPAAVAAPANDHFANRTALTGPLPIEVAESNAGATAEPEELIGEHALDARHSLWWEWEAPATEIVAIGTCGTEFPTVVSVFTGETFPPSWVPEDFGSPGGPECASQLVLPVVAGKVYDIGVDGNLFSPPGGPVWSGEGTIHLRIATLPPPPNDDFAAALPLTQETAELPDGSRRVLAYAWGYNWGATSEPGEPPLGGSAGDASVWYRWTAPWSGFTDVFAMQGEGHDQVLAVYSGDALGSLTLVSPRLQGPNSIEFMAEAGREYRIAFDGTAPPGGKPWMGSFHMNLSENVPPGPLPAATAPATATSSPQTAPQALRVPAKRAKKQVKHRCAVHPKRQKGCLARARFDVRARQRRQHAAG
jgi:hypothetical protein